MKKQLITTLLLTISAGAGNAMTSENIDSLSYAYGYQYTIATMAGKNDFMQSEQDFSDYIRGLEEGNRNLTQISAGMSRLKLTADSCLRRESTSRSPAVAVPSPV